MVLIKLSLFEILYMKFKHVTLYNDDFSEVNVQKN